ncbi:DUF1971 domain-containing protein [Leptolyngbya iicbica]|uniref:DUF1971 domain-containing protein n=2 Tax=Cyanophyceae TaxID=3028117 RepID=A0A4Q7E9Q3_9CYAN|nr:DUF1971 domain-containing protein [Leptolyngbya sp. LK]RZM79597.1 DUF1971 domain-containing protein [Leptolyngbya sp. LK]
MKSLPTNCVPYKRTAEFTDDSVPDALLQAHSTKVNVWGKIVVLTGNLTYQILEPEWEAIALRPGIDGVIEPTIKHQVVPQPGVRFYVEFYRPTL